MNTKSFKKLGRSLYLCIGHVSCKGCITKLYVRCIGHVGQHRLLLVHYGVGEGVYYICSDGCRLMELMSWRYRTAVTIWIKGGIVQLLQPCVCLSYSHVIFYLLFQMSNV